MLQLQLGEAGLLQGLPALSSQVASIKQKVPDGIQDLLPEVIPGGRLICYMLHEIKSLSLRKKKNTKDFSLRKTNPSDD